MYRCLPCAVIKRLKDIIPCTSKEMPRHFYCIYFIFIRTGEVSLLEGFRMLLHYLSSKSCILFNSQCWQAMTLRYLLPGTLQQKENKENMFYKNQNVPVLIPGATSTTPTELKSYSTRVKAPLDEVKPPNPLHLSLFQDLALRQGNKSSCRDCITII